MAQGLPQSPGWASGLVVAALAEDDADGMDGREIDHVEAHLGDVGQALFAIGEGAVLAGLGRGGAGKELVPGAESGANRIDDDGEFAVGFGGEALVGIAEDKLVQGGIGGVDAELFGLFAGAQDCGALAEPVGVGARRRASAASSMRSAPIR